MNQKYFVVAVLFAAMGFTLIDEMRIKPQCRSSFCGQYVVNLTSISGTIINVSDYNGETDQERIQNALNDVPLEGATVLIPSGIWQACNLSVKSRTIFMGVNNTVIRRPVNTTLPFLIFSSKSEFIVFDLIFEGQNFPEATGLLISNCTQFQLMNNIFRQISKNAIRVTGICNNFNITDNKFENCNIAPVILFGSPGQRYIQDFAITNNLLLNGTDNGKIGIAFATNGTISNNTIINCEHGIATRCVSNITIEYNHIEKCSGYAFYLGTQIADFGTNNVYILHNHAINCNIGISRWYGCQPIQNIFLKDNNLVNNVEWDIYLDFPAIILNNTLTSYLKLKLLEPTTKFSGNRNLTSQPIMPGDINHDLTIDMRDIGVTAIHFGLTSSSPGWDQSIDIIEDEIIDMKDIAFLANQFGYGWLN